MRLGFSVDGCKPATYAPFAMTARVMIAAWRALLIKAALLSVCLIALSVGSAGEASDGALHPTYRVCTDDAATADGGEFTPGDAGECDGTSEPGAHTAVTTEFTIESPDSHPAQHVQFIPPEWGVAPDADVPDGTLAGRVARVEGIGFLAGNCLTPVRFVFGLQDATTNADDTVPFHLQFAAFDGLELGVTKYPDYLLRILVDGTGKAVKARARYFGSVEVEGVNFSLNIVVLEPGTDIFGLAPSADLGYPIVAVFDDDGDPEVSPVPNPEPFFLSNQCSPFRLLHTAFDSVYTNPPTSGAYTFVAYSRSKPDADGDGHENALDACPLIANPEWDPRSLDYAGDRDRDFLPDNCDPEPDNLNSPGGALTDNDGDGYNNAQDNCPFADNSAGLPLAWASGPDNQADTDGDGIGDSCDPQPDEATGTTEIVCAASVVQIGSGGPAAAGVPDLSPCESLVFATATPLPAPAAHAWGDIDCSGTVDAVDALLALRFDSDLSVVAGECPPPGVEIELAETTPQIWGDIDCTGAVTPVDALKVMRHDVDLPVPVPPGCPELGTLVTVIG